MKRLKSTTPERARTNVYYGHTPYSIGPIYRYTHCPHCGGTLGGYPRLAHPHGYRWYARCHSCRYAAWEHEMDADIRGRIARRKAELAEATTVSGYSIGPGPDPATPDGPWCSRCFEDEPDCTCNQPPHEGEYLAAWRSGAFDADLVGYSDELAVVGWERLVAG